MDETLPPGLIADTSSALPPGLVAEPIASYDPGFMSTMGREASQGLESIKSGAKAFVNPSTSFLNPGELVKMLLGAGQVAMSPFTGAGAYLGEQSGEPVRKATEALGPNISAALGTAVGAPVNLLTQLLGPNLALKPLGAIASRITRPLSRGLFDVEAQNVANAANQSAIDTQRAMQWQQQMEEIQRIKAANETKVAAYNAQKADAEAMAAQTPEAYQQALARRDAAIAKVPQVQAQVAAQLPTIARPPISSSELYAPYDLVKMGEPTALPQITLSEGADVLKKIGGGIIQSTENLPKAAGPSGLIEKLSTGLAEGLNPEAALTKPIHPKALEFYGGSKVAPEILKQTSDQMYAQDALQKVAEGIGLEPGALSSLASGTLRLDELDRVLQLVGARTSSSKIATNIYRGLMRDLDSSTDPLAQQLYKAKAATSQEVVANDITSIVGPTFNDKTGKAEYHFGKLKTAIAKDELFPKTFPPGQKTAIVDTLETVFGATQEVKDAQQAMILTRPEVKKAIIVKPKLQPEVAPNIPSSMQLADAPGQQAPGFSQYQAQTQIGQELQKRWYVAPVMVEGIAHLAGIPIPWGVAAAGTLGSKVLFGKILPEATFKLLFKAAQTSTGRSLLLNLYRHDTPSVYNVAKLIAVGNFLGSQVQNSFSQGDPNASIP